MKTNAYAAFQENGKIGPFQIERRTMGRRDVQLEIDYCGVCHTDLHFVNNDWGMTHYPVVPGHEIVGRISAVGKEVDGFKVGQLAAVGCMIDSCGNCHSCESGLEQYCSRGFVGTYNYPTADPGGVTYGGYSKRIVCKEDFILSIPEKLKVEGTAPLLCAGITTYSPLKHWGVGPQRKVGIIGLGGLGHMGVKFSHAFGAYTVMITTSPEKGEDAQKLGADEILISTDVRAMARQSGQFDFILNTIPVNHTFEPYLNLLKINGVMCVVGAPEVFRINAGQLVFGRKSLTGSLIGGIAETQEMLNFCGERDIVSDVELIRMDEINEAYDRLIKSDVKYRFVIDMSSLN